MPVLLSPDDDPTFREPTTWRDRVKASRQRAVEEEVNLPF
jgi:hypothetical protein